ncbi:leucine-rich repeat receptor-like protein kinase cannot respond to DMBQ-like 3 PjCADL3 [Phtheirospermum japonicum]|uniref:Leucine-rich repeat receptor-like protein kinase cannot respond to DMBQ-like 3 PjCADL3 n=1 Tax=Phtheirospermum japonicum TaxID=374723 RepID=A0A830B093_9LAMI|nr:leucine-rich repeat receptor-like protein kinase cannot respond to DMBQ-like 3 PjCADL3 [Phtheirospermum japonicum]
MGIVTALQALKNLWTNFPPNWSGADPCGDGWDGIICINNRVVSITLASINLSGQLSSDIALLSELQTLSLNSNNFIGEIPPSIGNLENLYWLDLADNRLSGTIPVSNGTTPGLDMLVNTKHFHFGKNQLSGEIPPQLFNSSLTLIHLLLENNQLTGNIPSTLGLVLTLEVVRLDRNALSGSVPRGLSNLTSVQDLSLKNNQINGTLNISSSYSQAVGSHKSSNTGVIIGAAVGGTVLLLLLVVAGVYAFGQKRRAESAAKKSDPFASWDPNTNSGGVPQLKGAKCFSFEELKRSTNNFSETNCIGTGGYGKVYRGTLSDGQLVAIKRAQQGSMQGGLEFKTEIELLSRGYLDPEYYMTQQLTEKSDVYSFGVVLFELLTSRNPIEKGKYIVREVKQMMDKTEDMYNLQSILDPIVAASMSPSSVEKLVDLALGCVQELGDNRPSMSEVVKEIESVMEMAGLNPNADSAATSASYEGAKGSEHPYSNESLFAYSGVFPPSVLEPK